MKARADVAVGCWWRFTDYVIDNGYIRPAKNAVMVEYNPWQEFESGRAGRRGSPPYEGLLNLLPLLGVEPGRLGEYPLKLSAEGEQELLGWVQAYGLLGVLPHRTMMAMLRARWAESGRARARRRVCPAQRCLVRSAGRWWKETRYSFDFTPAQTIAPGQIVTPATLPPGLSPPHAVLADLRSAHVATEPLSATWARFFPDVPADQRDDFEYPLPFTAEFWRMYAEPIDVFIDAAVVLGEVSALVTKRSPMKRSRRSAADLRSGAVSDVSPALEALTALVSGIAQVPAFDQARRPIQLWPTPSLLAAMAMMLFQDWIRGDVIRRCENANCRRVVAAHAQTVRYCSTKCRAAAFMRRYRKKLTKVAGRGGKGSAKQGQKPPSTRSSRGRARNPRPRDRSGSS